MNSNYLSNTDEQIKERMLERIDTDVRQQAGTFINDILSPVSIEMAEIYIELSLLKQKMSIENIANEELDRYIEERSPLKRRQATRAKGKITIIGEPGKLIEAGLIVSNGNQNYKSLNTVILDESGKGIVDIKALDAGSKGNSVVNTINVLVSNNQHIHQVFNHIDVKNGFDIEDDNTYRNRYLYFIRTAPTSGNKGHYKIWAEEVEGVGLAKVIPKWNGINTVKVIITDYNMQNADKELVSKVQNYLDPGKRGLGSGVAPIGSIVTVESAKVKDLNISVEVSTTRNLNNIIKEIRESIENYFKQINFKHNEISYAKLGLAILQVEGIDDYKNLKVNNSIENIILEEDEVAVLKNLEVI